MEIEVQAPLFLPNVGGTLLHRAMTLLAHEGEAESGDLIEAEYIGMTKDSDGWPMKRYRVRIVKGR